MFCFLVFFFFPFNIILTLSQAGNNYIVGKRFLCFSFSPSSSLNNFGGVVLLLYNSPSEWGGREWEMKKEINLSLVINTGGQTLGAPKQTEAVGWGLLQQGHMGTLQEHPCPALLLEMAISVLGVISRERLRGRELFLARNSSEWSHQGFPGHRIPWSIFGGCLSPLIL